MAEAKLISITYRLTGLFEPQFPYSYRENKSSYFVGLWDAYKQCAERGALDTAWQPPGLQGVVHAYLGRATG